MRITYLPWKLYSCSPAAAVAPRLWSLLQITGLSHKFSLLKDMFFSFLSTLFFSHFIHYYCRSLSNPIYHSFLYIWIVTIQQLLPRF